MQTDPWQATRDFMQALADWEYPRPEVKGGCMRCRVTPEDTEKNRVIVSPSGLAHFGDGGNTACGMDATGDHWWWPL